MPYDQVVQKHIIGGDCFTLTSDQHFELKRAIADKFSLNPHYVVVVGSAKLGFSIARTKRYRHFGNDSDIDIAIVSDRLFDEVWQQVFEYSESPGRDIYWDRDNAFKTYLFRGWIRPDKLPPPGGFAYKAEWFEFFRSLTASGAFGEYKIAAGLYRSMYFLERYQGICTMQCQQELGGL